MYTPLCITNTNSSMFAHFTCAQRKLLCYSRIILWPKNLTGFSMTPILPSPGQTLGRNTSMWTTERVICIEFRRYVLIRIYLWAQPLDPEIYFYSATWLRIWKSLMPPDLPLKQEGRDHMFSGTRDNSEIESGIRGKKFPPSSIRDVCPFLLTLHSSSSSSFFLLSSGPPLR